MSEQKAVHPVCFEHALTFPHEGDQCVWCRIEELQQQVEALKEENIATLDDYMQSYTKLEIRAQRLEQQVEAMQWIPVSERLPNARQWVLTIDEHGFIDLGYLLYSEGHHEWEGLPVTMGSIIHWMPLPPPPEPQESKE